MKDESGDKSGTDASDEVARWRPQTVGGSRRWSRSFPVLLQIRHGEGWQCPGFQNLLKIYKDGDLDIMNNHVKENKILMDVIIINNLLRNEERIGKKEEERGISDDDDEEEVSSIDNTTN